MASTKSKNRSKSNIKAANSSVPKFSILGTYEGECADANITNLNGLDITVPVWKNVFNSEDFAQAIELGWYIGFLGHPEDPNCMDFEHACIVMTEGHLNSNGKVYGKFNLVDTPVGRIVKAFQDAGVTFGISVRGAGDIENNSVDPDTFVFRGFDLVTFPAYPESIPRFSEIAASTDTSKRAKYKSVCAAVNNNLDKITMSETLDVIKSQFAAQSDEYKAIEVRENELSDDSDDTIDLRDAKIESMTRLYLDEVEANVQLRRSNESLKRQLATTQVDCNRKLKSVKRITASQCASLKSDNAAIQSQLDELSQSCKDHIKANKRLNSQVSTLKNSNLKYIQKIDASNNEIRTKESIISRLRSELDETVNAASETKLRTSNLDVKNRKLQSEIEAANKLIAEYQDAYATLYANALGVDLSNVSVTATTSVSELQKLIGSTSTANLSTAFVDPVPIDIAEDISEDEMITI